MSKRAGVLVIGGGNIERAPDGGPVTKAPIADYLHELADRLGHCVWIVEDSGTWEVALGGATDRLAGHLDTEKVTVVPINGRVRGTARNWFQFMRYSLQRPHGVFFVSAFLTMVPLFPLAKLFLKKSAVYLAGDYEVTLADAPADKWRGWSTVYRWCYESSMRTADCVIARGRHLADIARRHNREVIETVPLAHIHGVDPVEPRALEPDAPRQVLYVGLILRSKGLADLMKALVAIRERRPSPPIRLDVLGDGPDRAELEALSRDLGLDDTVSFRGWIENRDEVNGYFARADVVVMPTSTHPEGVPRVIDEALVRRIPVVATRVAGVPAEFAGGEALLVDPGAPEQLAQAIEAVLFDSAVRSQYIDGAERRRLHWTRFSSAAEQHAKLLLGEIGGD